MSEIVNDRVSAMIFMVTLSPEYFIALSIRFKNNLLYFVPYKSKSEAIGSFLSLGGYFASNRRAPLLVEIISLLIPKIFLKTFCNFVFNINVL